MSAVACHFATRCGQSLQTVDKAQLICAGSATCLNSLWECCWKGRLRHPSGLIEGC